MHPCFRVWGSGCFGGGLFLMLVIHHFVENRFPSLGGRGQEMSLQEKVSAVLRLHCFIHVIFLLIWLARVFSGRERGGKEHDSEMQACIRGDAWLGDSNTALQPDGVKPRQSWVSWVGHNAAPTVCLLSHKNAWNKVVVWRPASAWPPKGSKVNEGIAALHSACLVLYHRATARLPALCRSTAAWSSKAYWWNYC